MESNSGAVHVFHNYKTQIHTPCLLTKVEQSSADQRDKNKLASVLSFHTVLFVFSSSQHIQLLSYATALNNVVTVSHTHIVSHNPSARIEFKLPIHYILPCFWSALLSHLLLKVAVHGIRHPRMWFKICQRKGKNSSYRVFL